MDRQKFGQIEICIDRNLDRKKCGIDKSMDRQIYGQTEIQIDRNLDRNANYGQIEIIMDRQKYGQILDRSQIDMTVVVDRDMFGFRFYPESEKHNTKAAKQNKKT